MNMNMDELIEDLSEEFVGSITDFDNEVVEEKLEYFLADRDMTPLSPHPIKVRGLTEEELDDEDRQVLQEYLSYEKEYGRLVAVAWLRTARKLVAEATRVLTEGKVEG